MCACFYFFPGHLPRFGSVCVSTRVRPSLARERRVFFHAARAVIQIRRRRLVKPQIIFKKEFVSNVKYKWYSA